MYLARSYRGLVEDFRWGVHQVVVDLDEVLLAVLRCRHHQTLLCNLVAAWKMKEHSVVVERLLGEHALTCSCCMHPRKYLHHRDDWGVDRVALGPVEFGLR